MKRINKSVVFLPLFFSIFLGPVAFGQDEESYEGSKFEWGINAGFMVYQGDLSAGKFGSLKSQKPNVNLHATRFIGRHLSVRVNFASGRIADKDENYEYPVYRKSRNFSFYSPVNELSFLVMLDPLGKNYTTEGISIYGYAGAGISFLNIKRSWGHEESQFNIESVVSSTRLKEDSAKPMLSNIPVIPIGGGLKYFISPSIALNIDMAIRLVSTDYLDGFSKSANPKSLDRYFSYGVGIIYRPGNN